MDKFCVTNYFSSSVISPLQSAHTSWADAGDPGCLCVGEGVAVRIPEDWAGWPAADLFPDRSQGDALYTGDPGFPSQACAVDRWKINMKAWSNICMNVHYCKLMSHISNLCEGLPATAVLDGFYSHRDFYRVSFRNPKALRIKSLKLNHSSSENR